MVIGIDLGGTNIVLGQIQNGVVVSKTSASSPSNLELEESLEVLLNTIAPLITADVKGIGIGVPSVLDVKRGIVYDVANISSWKEVHLKELLETRFQLPVFINNDSNCFTLGESRFGEGQSYNNMIGVTLGTGIGAGVIIDKKLYGGSNTGAGEIGCIPYLDATYEEYCASSFFADKYNTTGRQLAERAAANDAAALAIWREYGKHLGMLMQVALFTYDPDAIILGGGIAHAYPYFEQSMRDTFRTFPYPKSLEKLEIRTSQNPDIAILGAAALVEL